MIHNRTLACCLPVAHSCVLSCLGARDYTASHQVYVYLQTGSGLETGPHLEVQDLSLHHIRQQLPYEGG